MSLGSALLVIVRRFVFLVKYQLS